MVGTEGFEPSTTSTPCCLFLISRDIIPILSAQQTVVNKGALTIQPFKDYHLILTQHTLSGTKTGTKTKKGTYDKVHG